MRLGPYEIVLHELLSGVRASGEGDAFRSGQAPRARIVQKCLAANPQERFQTMAEVRAVLEHASLEMTFAAGEHKPSIAVLPFANMSADKENEYFGERSRGRKEDRVCGVIRDHAFEISLEETLHVPSQNFLSC